MTALQEFREMLLFEEKTSDQRSILLVKIMNAIGFSKSEREIHRHYEHPRNVLMNIFRVAEKSTITIAGSTAEGMRGGIYSDQRHGDDDLLVRNRTIKLYPPHTNHINNPHCYCYTTMKIMLPLVLSKKMTTFQDKSNYHWRK